MNSTLVRHRVEPDPPSTPGISGDLSSRLAKRALADRDSWKPAEPRDLSRRLSEAVASLERTAELARKRYESGAPVSASELWFVENRRLIESAEKNLDELFQKIGKGPRNEKTRGQFAIDAAAAYLEAAGLLFDRQAVESYFQAAQQDRPWNLQQVWSLKPALELALLERLDRASAAPIDAEATADDPQIGLCFAALIQIEQANWKAIFEALSETERTLSRDPAGSYPRMDFETRDRYRAAVGGLARSSDCSEIEIAEKAVGLAAEALRRPVPDHRAAERRSHVGYYLVDEGKRQLEREIIYRPSLRERFVNHVLRRPSGYYLFLVEIVTVAIILLLVSGTGELDPAWSIALLLLLPALDSAVAIANRLVTMHLPPRVPPKLDFSEGVPSDCQTLVAVPTLLLNEEQVDSMVDQLEVRFLANRDPNLAFALVTDTPDSKREVDEKDRLVDYCAARIRKLNVRYRREPAPPFFLLHRRRLYNESEQVWMGWERKRGKLLELNQFLLGASDPFPVTVGDISRLRKIRYVITLDSDTQLPKEVAQRLVGVMAHPLNRPVIDDATGIVVEGYALIQPRIGVSVQSAAKSRLAAVFSGETGFDIYTRAISETYQDLFGEGIFTGKGIYEVETFERVLNDRFPTNALLSHDLIEGIHARTGLSSDLELIDDYPSRFAAYLKRKHRWVRGDWQILRWLFPRVPTASGKRTRNPLSTISKWKIFDNLRRSLLDPAVFALLVCGWLFLPGGPLFWTVAVLIVFALPGYVELAFTLARLRSARHRGAALRRSLESFAESQMHVFLFLAFLPYNTLVMLDAIARTMRRVFVTGKRLLEWQTAAEAEMGGTRRGPVENYLHASAWIGMLVAAALAWKEPATLLIAGPLLLIWIFVKPMIRWLDEPPRPSRRLSIEGDEVFLRDAALLQWRFFAENSTAKENWLVPDSVQESPPLVIHRTSPTNIGLLLNAQLAALELGYLTLPEAIERLEASIKTIERLERPYGHLLNWYDTQTLRATPPYFISTVDNGNLIGCLWALKQGVLELLERPAISPAIKKGLIDHLRALQTAGASEGLGDELAQLQALAERWDELSLEGSDPFPEMMRLADRICAHSPVGDPWGEVIADRIRALRAAAENLTPWLRPAVRRRLDSAGIHLPSDVAATSLARTSSVIEALAAESESAGAGSNASLQAQRSNASSLVERIQDLAARAETLVREMNFGILLNRERKLLSVGYDMTAEALDRSCYDLLASEARMAVFAALAKGDIPQEAWFRLGRAHLLVADQCVLASWTGTLFEYLMPLLWMRSYPNTLLDNSIHGAIEVQKKAAESRDVPWGISEAGYGKRDEQGCYQYHAFGVPALALKQTRPHRDLPHWITAPYAVFLALQVDPPGALEALKSLRESGWHGRYGLYESIDFEAGWQTGCPVRSWMAHHQGMSLVAICNVLNGHPFRRWFHAEPTVAAAELLLHERVPRDLAAEAEEREAA